MRVTGHSSNSFYIKIRQDEAQEQTHAASILAKKDTVTLSKSGTLLSKSGVSVALDERGVFKKVTTAASDVRMVQMEGTMRAAASLLVDMRELAKKAEGTNLSNDERVDLQIELLKKQGALEKLADGDAASIDAATQTKIDAVERYRDRWNYPRREDLATLKLADKIKEDIMYNEELFKLNADLMERYEEAKAVLTEKYEVRRPDRDPDEYMEIGGEMLPVWHTPEYNLNNITDEGDRFRFGFIMEMNEVARIGEWEDLGDGRYFSQRALDAAVSEAAIDSSENDSTMLHALRDSSMSLMSYVDAADVSKRIGEFIDELAVNFSRFADANALLENATNMEQNVDFDQLAGAAANDIRNYMSTLAWEMRVDLLSVYKNYGVDVPRLVEDNRSDVPTVYDKYMSGYAKTGDVGFSHYRQWIAEYDRMNEPEYSVKQELRAWYPWEE